MTQETFDKLQDLIEDLASSDGVGYDSFEQGFIEDLQGISVDELSARQDAKVEEIWDKHVRVN